MKVIVQTGMKYIPTWRKNRKEPLETQIVITWNYLSYADKDEIFGIGPIKISTTGEVTNEYTFKPNNLELLNKSIKKIENLEIEVNGEYRPATINDIYNLPGFADLCNELVTFFTQENSGGEKKN